MRRLQEGKVLLSGLQGLGAEVAKNLVLMGVDSLTLHDPQPTRWADLAAQVRSREASQTGEGWAGVRPVQGRAERVSWLRLNWVSLQFFLSERDLERGRAEASQERVAKLNGAVQVCVHTGDITEDLLRDFQVRPTRPRTARPGPSPQPPLTPRSARWWC